MVAFGVVMADVFANKMSQVCLAEDDETIEALIANGFDEALSVWIAVWALRRDGDTGEPTAGKEQFPLLREQGITIVHQELRAPKKSVVGIPKIA